MLHEVQPSNVMRRDGYNGLLQYLLMSCCVVQRCGWCLPRPLLQPKICSPLFDSCRVKQSLSDQKCLYGYRCTRVELREGCGHCWSPPPDAATDRAATWALNVCLVNATIRFISCDGIIAGFRLRLTHACRSTAAPTDIFFL